MKAETLAHYESFALAYVRDPSQSLAALVRKIVNPRMKVKTASDLASHWMKPTHAVAKRIAELQADIRVRAEAINAEAEANGTLPVFLDIEEKRRFLAECVRFKPLEFDPIAHGHILSGIRKTQFGTNYDYPDKLAAMKLDNDLSGDGAQAKGSGSVAEALTALVSKLRK
jgi:hypothetical protein